MAHSCNLSCESCSHYTNQGHQGIVSVEEAERWMTQWKRRIQPRLFAMVGGEPAMHPHLAEFVRASRRHWPSAELRLISNGFLLKRHPDLPAVLRDTNTCLCVSIHHPSPQYEEKLRPVRELLEEWELKYGIRLEYLQSYRHWTRRYHGSGSAIRALRRSAAEAELGDLSLEGAPSAFRGEALEMCAVGVSEAAGQAVPTFGPVAPLPEVPTAAAGLHARGARGLFCRGGQPCCGMCPSKPIPFELPLPFPASVARPSRRLAA